MLYTNQTNFVERDIENMSAPALKNYEIEVRNEVAFARSDESIGGPSHTDALTYYRGLLARIDAALKRLAASH